MDNHVLEEARNHARAQNWKQAAAAYEALSRWIDAATCHQRAGDGAAAIAAYTQLPAEHPHYRRACIELIPLALSLGHVSAGVDRFLTPFLQSDPRDAREAERVNQFRASRLPTPSPPTPPTPAPKGHEGLVAGRYRLEKLLGEGGLARVFQARDLELDESVALKVFRERDAAPDALSNFREELKLTRRLVHPNIVRLFDLGVHDGHRFLTLELLEGTDVRALTGRPLAVERALNLLVQACAALQAAHDAGVIHRDIKPENLFVGAGDALKVMDFGLARRVTSASGTGGMAAGTPAYVSPEQIQRFDSVGPSADLYSLGVVAYELLCGRPPFTATSVEALLQAQLRELPAPLRSHNPSLPGELEQVVLRLLEKSPARRYRSCLELAAALEPIRQRHILDDFL